jgi:hypothetical protein
MKWKTMTIGVVAAGIAGCGLRAAADPVVVPENGVLAIVVQHNVPVAGSISIRLFDPAGAWQHLGTVAPAQTETFVIEDEPSAGTYRLVAETPDGRRATSRPFPPYGPRRRAMETLHQQRRPVGGGVRRGRGGA